MAGCSSNCTSAEGADPLHVAIHPRVIAFDSIGTLYIADYISGVGANSVGMLRRIAADGLLVSIAGGGSTVSQIGGKPALGAWISPFYLVVGPDDRPHVAWNGQDSFYRIALPLPTPTGATYVIGDRSGARLFDFDPLGQHVSTRNSLTGSTLLQFGYGPLRLLSTITDAFGNTTQVVRASDGKPAAIVGPYGQRTELELNANGFLSGVTDPIGNRMEMTYTPKGLLTSVTNARGAVSTMEYDAEGRLTLDRDPVGGEHRFVEVDHHVERTTALGRVTTYDTQKPISGTKVRTMTVPAGDQTTRTRTADQRAVVTRADGTIVTTQELPDARFGLNAPNPTRSVATPSGLVRTQAVSTSYSGLNLSNPFAFDSQFHTTAVNGLSWTTTFTPWNRTYTANSPTGRRFTRTVDATGQPTSEQLANFLPTEYSYDSSGRLVSMTQGNRITTMTYDAQTGYVGSVTDPLLVATTHTRDALGRPLTETRAGATTVFGWDPGGNLTSVAPPGRPIHSMTYTDVDLTESYNPPAAGLSTASTNYSYDLERMLRTTTLPTGDSVTRTPDTAGRTDKVAVPGGLLDYDYYPPASTSGAGKTSDIRGPYDTDLHFTYDGFLTTSTAWSGDVIGSVNWQYNNDFKKTKETVNGQAGSSSAVFNYDSDQLLTCASPVSCAGTSSASALRLTRSSQHGLITGLSLGSTTETWTYNEYGEHARQTATFGPSTVLLDITYDAPGFERDKLGRIVQKTELVAGVTKVYRYSYDALRRLTDVMVGGALAQHFEYDANGNRTLEVNATPSSTRVGAYDEQDRLTSYGPWAFTYTANGELESKTNTNTGETWLFEYDAFHNLVSVELPSGDLIEYLVDGLGRRVGKSKNGVLLRRWMYRDKLNPVAELDSSGNLVSQFVYGAKNNVPDYVLRNGVIYRVISDHLGSPRRVVNASNGSDVPFVASFSAFGEVTGTGLDWIPFGFAGGIYDADTGLVEGLRSDHWEVD